MQPRLSKRHAGKRIRTSTPLTWLGILSPKLQARIRSAYSHIVVRPTRHNPTNSGKFATSTATVGRAADTAYRIALQALTYIASMGVVLVCYVALIAGGAR